MYNLELGVVYKGVSKREGGEFTNEKGQTISYDPCYVIKFDEDVDGEIIERKLKFPITNKTLFNKLNAIDAYSKILLLCDVQLFASNAKVTPRDLK